MTLIDVIDRVRSYTRDTTGTLFSRSDIVDFANEGIDRLKQISALNGMNYLVNDSDVPKFLPLEYQYSIAIYSASRCFTQDEQTSFAQTFMQEFEGLFSLLDLGIKEGTIKIVGDNGSIITDDNELDTVKDVYFSEV